MSYGCFNRQPLKESYTLHGTSSATGKPISITVQHRMTTDCQYQKFDRYNDPQCQGCIHKVIHE